MTKQIIVCLTAMILTTTLVSAQIDVHCHMIPDSYLEAVKAHGMEMDEGFHIPEWSAEEHLEFMDKANAEFKAQYPEINWKAGKTLNRASKSDIKAWVDSLK